MALDRNIGNAGTGTGRGVLARTGTVETISDLQSFNGPEDAVIVQGHSTAGDGGGGKFYWDATSTDTADNALIVQATGVTTGRWKRIYDDCINVKWFGATGDGSTDDTASIQLAIDSVSAGHKVVFPIGDYLVTSSLTINSNLWLQGDGEGTYIDFSTATSYDNLFELVQAQVDDVRISDMRMRGQSDNANVSNLHQGCAVLIDASTKIERFKAFNLRIERFHQGIRLDATGGNAESPEIANCWFDEIAYSCVDLRNATSPLVHGNTFDLDRTGIGDATDGIVGVWCAAGLTGEANNTLVRVEGNTVLAGSGESINIQASTATITGNTIMNGGPDSIIFEPTVQSAPTAAESRQVSVISNNIISNYGDRGITVRSDPANNTRSPTHLIIADNVIETGTQGIRIGWATDTTSGAQNIIISGNMVSDATGASIVLDGATGVVLSGNMLTDSGLQGMNIIDSFKVNINGGYIVGSGATSDGITFDNTDNVQVTGMVISNTGRYGIEVANASDNISIMNNVFEDDQGTPTMDSAVHVTSGTNISTFGNTVNGVTGNDFANMPDPQKVQFGNTFMHFSANTPEGAITAGLGEVCFRQGGPAGTQFYVKETSSGNTGWVAK